MIAVLTEIDGLLTCCRLCARGVCTAQSGSAWQAEEEEGGEEGSRPGGGRAAGEEMEEAAGEGGVAPKALPSAKSEA